MESKSPGRWFSFTLSITFILSLIFNLTACSEPTISEADRKLKVLSTTTIVADVVQQIGGDLIELEVLLPIGVDPHTFAPTPQDLARISSADLVFINGAGLEEFMQKYLDNIREDVEIIEVSKGVSLIQVPGDTEHVAGDPHTWTDPSNVKVWVENIVAALEEADPENSESYRESSKAYMARLDELDAWIEEQVSQIPQENRKIVSDHESLAYFTERYGFTQIGTVIPGTSTLAEPSAQDTAQLEDLIRQENIPAIFVDTTANPRLTERISSDLGIKVIPIYSGSLTDPEGEAGSYLDYMRYNVLAIIEALR
jgi:ABC-type Zn uptake system ZnuABC Zn-binding protein ZnuA